MQKNMIRLVVEDRGTFDVGVHEGPGRCIEFVEQNGIGTLQPGSDQGQVHHEKRGQFEIMPQQVQPLIARVVKGRCELGRYHEADGPRKKNIDLPIKILPLVVQQPQGGSIQNDNDALDGPLEGRGAGVRDIAGRKNLPMEDG
nr:hypothetical protein [Desulfosarcina cetonica]